MANGEHDWWTTLLTWAQGAIAAVASAASSAVAFMAYRYRKYVGMLLAHERRLARINRYLVKVKKVIDENEGGRKNARLIETCRMDITRTQQEVMALNDEVEKLSTVVSEYSGTLKMMVTEINRMRDTLERILPFASRRNTDG